MNEFFTALIAVAAAELGDKTQFIALLLAARYSDQRAAVVAGVVLSTIVMHGIASSLGFVLGDFMNGSIVSIAVGIAFIIMGLAMLRPEKEEDDDDNDSKYLKYGAFFASFMLLSLSEIADKSQIVTMMLAARYETIVPVALGAVVGMNLLLLPVVFFGAWITTRVPMHVIRYVGCAVFVGLGLFSLISEL
ncbi:MAG: TMEM165/GDT1 family protein [Gammaproteobacteria bacterium]|nr:TMEM165/GDT1 family protein [Gammaproteobacteria bacterium]